MSLQKPNAARSRIMSAIRGRGNKTTEEVVARLLRQSKHSGWRRHAPLPGRPDFAFRQERVAIFVDGCFWHGCPRCYKEPRRNTNFWREKIERNKARDREARRKLNRIGWSVIRIWEHSLLDESGVKRRISKALSRAEIEHAFTQ